MANPLLRQLEDVCEEDEGTLIFSAYVGDLLVLVNGQFQKSLEARNKRVMTLLTQRVNSVDVNVSPDRAETMLLKRSLSSNIPSVIRVFTPVTGGRLRASAWELAWIIGASLPLISK